MELVFKITLFIAGLINFVPFFVVFLPEKMTTSYGIDIPNADFELLLRHRAVLFGIIGGLLLYSALTRKYYDLATLIGLISMISFLLLFFMIDGKINDSLTTVMKIDAFAIIQLLIGFMLYKFGGAG